MALGGGETLDVFATLLGVSSDDRPAFARTVQANFGELFPSGDTTVGEMLNSLDGVLARDERLARYVRS
jgi:cytochrome P450